MHVELWQHENKESKKALLCSLKDLKFNIFKRKKIMSTLLLCSRAQDPADGKYLVNKYNLKNETNPKIPKQK